INCNRNGAITRSEPDRLVNQNGTDGADIHDGTSSSQKRVDDSAEEVIAVSQSLHRDNVVSSVQASISNPTEFDVLPESDTLVFWKSLCEITIETVKGEKIPNLVIRTEPRPEIVNRTEPGIYI